MTAEGQGTGRSPAERLGEELRERRDAGRLLLVVPDGAPGADAIDAAAVRWDPTGARSCPEGAFGLVLCAEAIQAGPHPANLLLALWEAMPVGGTLLLHSRVMADPGRSTYARFVAADARVGDTAWLPGRMALRWTVETSGFDLERWLDAGRSDSPEGDAYLVAIRADRAPALAFSAQAGVGPPSQEGDRS